MCFAPYTPTSFPPTPEDVFNAALVEYFKQTENDLVKHPLSAQLESCKSYSDFLIVLGEPTKTFREFRDGNKKLVKVFEPTVNVMCSLSRAFGGLVSPLKMARLR
jgi:hypothetical protein